MSNVNQRLYAINKRVEGCYIAQKEAFAPLEYPFLQEIISRYKIGSVLDIGTGEGTFINGLAERTPKVSYLAVEADSDLIAVANLKYNHPNLTFKTQEFNTSFSTQQYDMVTARFAVEHMDNPQTFVAEACRRLKPNGILLVTEYFVDPLHNANPSWQLFRNKELELYRAFGSHPQVALELPRYMKVTGLQEISSDFRHISPSTVGSRAFYQVVIEYAKLYHQINPEIWTDKVAEEVIRYAKKAVTTEPEQEDILLISHTIGIKR